MTQALLTRVAAAFHGGIDDVLLTGLAVAVADWCRRQGAGSGAGQAVLLDLEGHGREELDELLQVSGDAGDIDLTRTVGWFTSLYPVRLDPGPLDLEQALAVGAPLGRALKTIKEQLRAVPGKGLGYGLLRYLNAETAATLAAQPAPQLGFNYLGRFAGGGADGRRQRRRRTRRGCAACRRRSGDAAGACDRDQRADAGGGGRPAAGGELELCPGAARRGCGRRSAENWFRVLTALAVMPRSPARAG